MNVLWEAENIDRPVPEGRLRPNTNNGIVASNGRIVAAMSDLGERHLTLFAPVGTLVEISRSHPSIRFLCFTGSGRLLVGMSENETNAFVIDVGRGGLDEIGDLEACSLLESVVAPDGNERGGNSCESEGRDGGDSAYANAIRGFLVKDDVVFESFSLGGFHHLAHVEVTVGRVSTAIPWDGTIWKALVR